MFYAMYFLFKIIILNMQFGISIELIIKMKKVKSKLELFGECFLAEVGSYLGLEGWVGLWERKSKEEGLLD